MDSASRIRYERSAAKTKAADRTAEVRVKTLTPEEIDDLWPGAAEGPYGRVSRAQRHAEAL